MALAGTDLARDALPHPGGTPRPPARPRPLRFSGGDDTSAIQFGPVRDTALLDGAFRLVHDQYVWRGFMTAPHPTGRRVSLWNSLPSTRVFAAHVGDRVLGTATLIRDSPLGLPMDGVFGDLLAPFRRRGRLLSEVSALAMDADRRAHGMAVLMRLLRVVLLYAAEVARLDDLCLVVRPQHVAFYERCFSCRVLGEARDYAKVNLPDATPLHLDLSGVRASIRNVQTGGAANEVQAFLFGGETCAATLAALGAEPRVPGLTPAQFTEFFRGQQALATAPRQARIYVESFYESAAQGGHTSPGATPCPTPGLADARALADAGAPRWSGHGRLAQDDRDEPNVPAGHIHLSALVGEASI